MTPAALARSFLKHSRFFELAVSTVALGGNSLLKYKNYFSKLNHRKHKKFVNAAFFRRMLIRALRKRVKINATRVQCQLPAKKSTRLMVANERYRSLSHSMSWVAYALYSSLRMMTIPFLFANDNKWVAIGILPLTDRFLRRNHLSGDFFSFPDYIYVFFTISIGPFEPMSTQNKPSDRAT